VLRLRSGALALTYGRDADPARATPGHAVGGLYLRKSHDEGKTWGAEVEVAAPAARLDSLYDTLMQTSTGRLIWPAYASFAQPIGGLQPRASDDRYPQFAVVKVLYSDDEGETWAESEHNLFLWEAEGLGRAGLLLQATVAETACGRLLMFGHAFATRVAEAYSEDWGETWSLVRLNDLCTCDSPARVARIPSSGDLVVVWNQTTAAECAAGLNRCRLTAAVSEDSGKTWGHFRNIMLQPGLDENARLVDPEPPHFVKPEYNIRTGFVRGGYPNVHFFGDMVYVHYEFVEGKPPSGQGSAGEPKVGQKLRVLPVEWFYEGR
jgi:hypothetical protein